MLHLAAIDMTPHFFDRHGRGIGKILRGCGECRQEEAGSEYRQDSAWRVHALVVPLSEVGGESRIEESGVQAHLRARIQTDGHRQGTTPR